MSIWVVAGRQVTSETQAVADFHMELLLKEAYDEVKVIVGRNRAALDVLVEALLANSMIRCGAFVGVRCEALCLSVDSSCLGATTFAADYHV